jgi:tetratricopeptide (TPR) repeat protein
MPLLSDLKQFKSSFNNIANEKDDIESLKLPFNDFPLPKTEAPPFNFDRDSLLPGNTSEPPVSDGDFDFNDFAGTISDDDPSPPPDTALSALDDFLSGLNSPAENAVPDIGDFLNGLTPPADEEAETAVPDIGDFLNGLTPPADEEAETAVPDIGDFLNGLTPPADEEAETAVPDIGDFLNGLTPPADEEAEAAAPDIDDFSVPDDLLSGLSDEIESAPADSGSEDFSLDDFGIGLTGAPETDETPDFASGDFEIPENTNDFGDIEGTGDFETTEEAEDFGGIDLGGEIIESQAGEPGTDDFSFEDNVSDMDEPSAVDTSPSDDTIDLGGESLLDFENEDFPSSLDDESSEQETGSFDSGNDGIDLGGESAEFEYMDENGDFSMDGFLPDMDSGSESFGDDFNQTEDSASSDSDSDSLLGLGDFGSDFESESIDLESESEGEIEEEAGFSSEVFSNDDFSLAGLDEILNKSKVSSIPVPTPKKGLFGRKKASADEVPEAEETIEEISLSQDDVNSLLRTLSSYPLNLRIACEELIAEQVILPAQLTKLIRLLVNGAHVKETAAHVQEITGKPIVIPKSFEKMTGAAFEAEQSSFAYIFVHNFLPVFRLFAVIALLAASVLYLGYNFIYIPIAAESIYKRGYERIPAGEYQRANELFQRAFSMHRKKKWFYLYAEAFIDQRRFMLAEGKYDELLRFYPRDKKGVLDYAHLNTYYLMNFEKANRLLQRELLDYAPNDREGLLAAGDNFLAWADSNPSRFFDRYEDARFSYARLLELFGWQPPVVERMMKYFIRVDNLREVLQIRIWFENNSRRRLSAESLGELGGYLLDKQLERPGGVPSPYIESIESVRDMLLQAVMEDHFLPEPHYHLARYHHSLGNVYEERLTLENAIRAFDLARRESINRRLYRVDAHFRYANLLINNREFFPAEEQVVRGIGLFEDFLNRNLIPASAQLGQLYSLRGDLEYFVKSGDMAAALNNYRIAERLGFSPPEVQYRMGAAFYQLEDWRNALEYLFRASAQLPLNRRLLFALGNATYQRGDFFAAQGYYNRLLDMLENQRVRLPVLLPNDNPQFLELGERLMMARNNAGVVNEALADQTGNRDFRSRAMVLYVESARAWDSITRNPESMTRMRLTESPGAPSINLGYLNANNALRPNSDHRPQIFVRIDRDVLEPSRWEEITSR